MATRTRKRWGGREPLRADYLAREAGEATRAALGCPKRVAQRLGRSQDSVYLYASGHTSSPAYRFGELLRAVEHPEHLVTWAKIEGLKMRMQDMTPEQLRADLEEIVARMEPLADARAKLAALAFAQTPDCAEVRRELRRTLAAEAALQERAVAILDLIENAERQS